MANFTFLDIGDGDLLDIGNSDLLLLFLSVPGVIIYNVPAEDRIYEVPRGDPFLYQPGRFRREL